MLPLVKEGANIVVTRTFSKIFGMAGLRVGYGVADSGDYQALKTDPTQLCHPGFSQPTGGHHQLPGFGVPSGCSQEEQRG